jgi:hypothetical protein
VSRITSTLRAALAQPNNTYPVDDLELEANIFRDAYIAHH